MKLYLISRTDNWGYDDFDAFVVAAENEESALEFHPIGRKDYLDEEDISWGHYSGWTSKENIKVEYIGESNSLVEKVIISSFNAG